MGPAGARESSWPLHFLQRVGGSSIKASEVGEYSFVQPHWRQVMRRGVGLTGMVCSLGWGVCPVAEFIDDASKQQREGKHAGCD